MDIKKVTNENFETEVLKSDRLTLVDFWATWCGPCTMLAPVLEELNSDFEDKIKICKVNIDENGEKAMEYKIMSIPTVMFFKDGEMTAKLVGVRDKAEYAEIIEQNI